MTVAFSDSVYLMVVPTGAARTAVVWLPTRKLERDRPTRVKVRIGAGLKVALAARACDIVTVQVLSSLKPEQAPALGWSWWKRSKSYEPPRSWR